MKVDPNLAHCEICGDVAYIQMMFFYEEVADRCCPECLDYLLIAEEVLARALKLKI